MTNLKQNIKCIIFAIVCIFCSFGIANAADYVDTINPISYNETNVARGWPFSSYENLSCTADPSPYWSYELKDTSLSRQLIVSNTNTSATHKVAVINCVATAISVTPGDYTWEIRVPILASTSNGGSAVGGGEAATGATNQTIHDAKSYALFPTESLNLVKLLGIRHIFGFEYVEGKEHGVFTITGCTQGNKACLIAFDGAKALRNRTHKMNILYVDKLGRYHSTRITIVERDPGFTTKAYPGALGFCEFNDDWEYTQWNDEAGKKYSFYESTVKGAVLPDCSEKTENGTLLKFMGWSTGYENGDTLTTSTTCGKELVAPGTKTTLGENYAPCYQLVPHVRLSTNGGTIKIVSPWEFNSKEMTYVAKGTTHTETVALPDVIFTGYQSGNTVEMWKNNTTGATAKVGDRVPLDGSVWTVVTSRTTVQVDLYKTIGLGQTDLFTVNGMTNCSISSSSDYLRVTYKNGDCEVEGKLETPFNTYVDVTVTLSNGTVRVYKFNVEDRTGINQDGNGIFNVDTSDNVEIGKNDESTLNQFNTDQCQNFFISRNGYEKFTFAKSISTGEDMNTGIYSVYQLCPTDYADYVGFCLDPGRRGPNEWSTGTHSKKINYKGKIIYVYGNEYAKVDDIKEDSDLGKVISYVVQHMGISDFGSNDALIDENKIEKANIEKRAASHVAIRTAAIMSGFSSVVDAADEVYSSHYRPYDGLYSALEKAKSDGNITEDEARDAVENGDFDKKGVRQGFKNWNSIVKENVIDIFANYDGEDTMDNSGFERTIDDSKFEQKGDGYTINYKGTITAPTGATATMTSCRDDSAHGVKCILNSWTETSETDGRKVYSYDVTIEAPDASKVIPPNTVEEEKDVSFQIEYSGGYDLVNAFIASPTNGSDNVQRMLIISTTNPKVYIYFSIVPNTCDLDIFNVDYCKTEAECDANVEAGKFNPSLFKAAGCCRYQLSDEHYVTKNICNAECTSSTLTSVCEYVADGSKKADFYEINEGAKYDGTKYKPAIGTCIVNVTDLYKNDGASSLEIIDPAENFTKYDDGANLINVDAYNDNRYCQVTCEEDWEFSMDSFGNFVGANAVAAGTFFEIRDNDMFISGKRTCYTTFINYDRFMANVVDISNLLVQSYNTYSRWSHVWTDIDRQVNAGYGSAGDYKSDDSGNGTVCVEYFKECPDGYYWDANAVSGGTKGCKQVPNYGQTENATCESTSNNSDYKATYGHYDGDADYDNEGKNENRTQCTFTRYYCDGHGLSNITYGTISEATGKCTYTVYQTRPTANKCSNCTGPQTGYNYIQCTEAGGSWIGNGCLSPKCSAGDSYYSSNGLCYTTCPNGGKAGIDTYDKNRCYYTQTKWAKAATDLKVSVVYNETNLRCKVWGKGYDYTLRTENDVTENGKNGKDIYYGTKESNSVSLAGKTQDGSGDNNTENEPTDGSAVMGNYKKEYTHDCTLTAAAYQPGAQGSSSCQQAGLESEVASLDSYSKTNEMFCADGQYANLEGTALDKAFCYAGEKTLESEHNSDAKQIGGNRSNKADAFEWITNNFKEHAKKELDEARSSMTSYNSQIYSHAQDVFDCQHFQLHNNTDDLDSTRANNKVKDDTVMKMTRSYVKILTEYDPIATYTYDEEGFMTILGKDNVLEQYTEKNEEVFKNSTKTTGATKKGDGTICTDSYKGSTNCQVDATITTPNGPINTKLNRNFIENYYYNPSGPWTNATSTGKKIVSEYHDPSSQVTTPVRATKQLTLCTVGKINNGTGYAAGKDGAYVAFTSMSSTPEWLGGYCYTVDVDYKEVHYVKSSITNSSYFKNKGNWYLRGGDIKEHGETIEDALKNANKRSGNNYAVNDREEQKRWSRLGSFNVFPISMATPRNLYQYTYTFGNIGSYYDGRLGRIMGTEKSIIQNNKRTCFYEVYEEVCLCCGYRTDTSDLTPPFLEKYEDEYGYDPSTPPSPDNYDGTLSFYSNSVSLGDLDLGRDDTTAATNWSDKSPFMYNGDSSLTTDKGYKLKENIENNGENIYASEPEYAYYLDPGTLRAIRDYNDNVGYELNYNNLIVYEVNNIACDGASCGEGNPETVNFQHYGSKFLLSGSDKYNLSSNLQQINLDARSYGLINASTSKVCTITDTDLTKTYNISNKMKQDGCRWIDYIETNNSYYNPTSKTTSNQYFRLAFK